MIFLSYTKADEATAREIIAELRARNIELYNWQEHHSRFTREIEQNISTAAAFVALMSPDFVTSAWCHRERVFAIQREHDMQARDPQAQFIHVVKIRETPHADAGFLSDYAWYDLTNETTRSRMLGELVRTLTHPDAGGPGTPSKTGAVVPPSADLFRNRRDELDLVLHGLTNASGPHFWFVTAPPQLGKSWFLYQLYAEIMTQDSGAAPWQARLVDLRWEAPELRDDATALLNQLFAPVVEDDRPDPITIAEGISNGEGPYLCLLDSAELLTDSAVKALRKDLSSIYSHVRAAGNIDVRLAFVIATREENVWRGVYPPPRLTDLSLSEFTEDVVEQTLRDIAVEMDRRFSAEEFKRYAASAHDLSEGLPALLVECLRWIRKAGWVKMARLDTDELFSELAEPYVKQQLLSSESLCPNSDRLPPARHLASEPAVVQGIARAAVEQAFRILAPYRLFTKAHLRYHAEIDAAFADSIRLLGWTPDDITSALNRGSLLRRLLNEPWQEIQPAIRRLLYRFFYTTDEERVHAHNEARKFVEVWMTGLMGKEQCLGLVECLWHEAGEFRLSEPAEMEARLLRSARQLSLSLPTSEAYTVEELRSYAASRLVDDEEFRRTIENVPELFDKIIAIVHDPSSEPGDE